jgi:hypothetical protein
MPSDRDRLDKVSAIAVNPGAYETEAVAALCAARKLIKKNPGWGGIEIRDRHRCAERQDVFLPATIEMQNLFSSTLT